ncbi:MAG: uracil-DNA glycosylase [Actinobacteria bacterium]|nr:uracil-DNA glycosylase [Actinomycetota bacterium]
MRTPQPGRGGRDAGLHLGERFAAGKAEAAGVALHRLPLRQLHERLQFGARPLAEVAFEQALVDLDLDAEGHGDRRGGLPGPLQRRGVHGRHVGQRGDALGRGLGLPASVVGQAQPRSAAGKDGPRRRRATVADVEGDGGRGQLGTAGHGRRPTYSDPVPTPDSLERVTAEIVDCFLCPRLVDWREQVAREKRASFADEEYWGRPIPGFGDPDARLLIVGLAPAAHGGNRTGRVFTGDRSGDWLFRALWRAGYANQPTSVAADDGLVLTDAYIAAAVRCAPPANKPLPEERDRCLPYLRRELDLLHRLKVIVVLGQFGYDAVARLVGLRPKPRFGHGVEVPIDGRTIVCSYHPSQQNTFTGTLTEPMFDAVFERARALSLSRR